MQSFNEPLAAIGAEKFFLLAAIGADDTLGRDTLATRF
jgi:hypothetical protein